MTFGFKGLLQSELQSQKDTIDDVLPSQMLEFELKMKDQLSSLQSIDESSFADRMKVFPLFSLIY
jgi:hypothetical protein